jgi:Flp pilus assembly protein TadG
MRNSLQALMRSQSGVAYMEFAIGVTFLMILFLGSVEVTRFVLINQKIQKTVVSVTDVVTQAGQGNPLTTTGLSQIMSAVGDMMNPYTFGAGGVVFVTDVTQPASGNPIVNWQYCGGGTLHSADATVVSKIGTTVGGTATLPSGFTMNSGEEVVIGEIYYKYSPIIVQSMLANTTLYNYAVYMPRLGALTSLVSSCP